MKRYEEIYTVHVTNGTDVRLVYAVTTQQEANSMAHNVRNHLEFRGIPGRVDVQMNYVDESIFGFKGPYTFWYMFSQDYDDASVYNLVVSHKPEAGLARYDMDSTVLDVLKWGTVLQRLPR